ncbi:MAG: hypothetical protein K2K24_00290, partial [Clostridia bacterium]|nr:hypothetical protein [Clostridia bacterium]
REDLLEKAKIEADKIIADAYAQREEDRQKLIDLQRELELREEEIRCAEDKNRRKEDALRLREELLGKEVEERVADEYADIIAQRDRFKEGANKATRDMRILQDELKKYDEWRMDKAEFEKYKDFLKKLQDNDLDFDRDVDGLIADKKELNKLRKKCLELNDENNKLQEKTVKIISERQLDANYQEQLNTERLQKEHYEGIARQLIADAAKNKEVTRDEMLQHVFSAPECIIKNRKYRDEIGELEWLKNIKDKAEANKLYFTDRQLYAYHTAQKIHNISSLVVLAGPSGTGKSELPKNYALHGGMQFLSIPVKPDWDSPASLFGYYNSIERRFEATELLRALYQMDKGCEDQMMMVLLDEMNLAHPEQYFADLLSKLETSRGSVNAAQYELTLGGGQDPYPIKIGDNVLWTGTMNEDETTKGLSDKVIDRSTLITFPTPKELKSRGKVERVQTASDFLLKRSNWQAWLKPKYGNDNDILETAISGYRETIEKINGHMSKMSRNLGHRVWQGVEEYVRNYPTV